MTGPTVTLTTDFGEASPYVAALKGALLSVNPQARLLDLSHSLRPFDVRQACFFLAQSLGYFPRDSLHVVVVDPGVGTDRALLCVCWQGRTLLVPDNGCWSWLPDSAQAKVIRLTERAYWRDEVCSTFHGRDILAPVAGHLSLGLPCEKLGPTVDTWVTLPAPFLQVGDQQCEGEILEADTFGNLLTNIPSEKLVTSPTEVWLSDQKLDRPWAWVRTYGQASPGSCVLLTSSFGCVELAIVQGNAQRALQAEPGMRVRLVLR